MKKLSLKTEVKWKNEEEEDITVKEKNHFFELVKQWLKENQSLSWTFFGLAAAVIILSSLWFILPEDAANKEVEKKKVSKKKKNT